MNIKANEIEIVSIDSLIPYQKNMNRHTPEQIEKLIELIKYQGFRDPLIVQKGTGIVVAGNGRLEAAKKMGMKNVPVTYQEFENEAQLYAFVVSHNAINSSNWGGGLDLAQINTDIVDIGPDLDLELLGIKDFVLEPIEKSVPQADEDDVPKVKSAITLKGDMWVMGRHRLLCGDSTLMDDVERLMCGEVADFGFCDPPYNLGFSYNEYDDNKTDAEYIEFSKLWFSNLQLISNKQCVTLGTKNIPLMSVLGDVAGVACWVKKNWVTGCHIAKLQQWEPIFFYGDYTKFKRTSDLFEVNRKVQKDVGNDHTCPKQIDLIVDIFDNYSCEKSLIVDLFGGSGTSLIACEKLNRKSYLMEMDPVYCDVIVKRWQNYTGQKAILESTGQTYDELREVSRDNTTEC